MELSLITKFLLWCLSKRSDIGGVKLHEHGTEVVEISSEEYRDLIASLGLDLEPDEIDGGATAIGLDFDRDHLQDCFDAPSAVNPDRPD